MTTDKPDYFIGSVPIYGRVALAPMAGVTDSAFRHIARRLGAAFTVSEMVSVKDYVRGTREARTRAEIATDAPHIVQISGCDPAATGEVARRAEERGAHVIDINMGCPAKRVIGGYAGAALMRDLNIASQIIVSVINSVTIPVSVKMRLGWDQDSKNAAQLVHIAEESGVCCVTVHGRTRNQKYQGRADWQAIGEIAEQATIPVVANGDIATLDDARQCLAQSHADGLMVGRAAMGCPWLPGLLNRNLVTGNTDDLSIIDKHDIISELYDNILILYGKDVGVRHARKHLAAFMTHLITCGYELTEQKKSRILLGDDPASIKAGLRSLL